MPRRILEGEVVSDKTDKTITVRVERRYMHPIYKKYVKKSSKFTAHDPKNKFKTGDRVEIIECRPISKTKRWIVVGEELAAPGQKSAANASAKPKAAAPKAEKKVASKKSATDKPAKKTSKKKDD